MPGDLSITSGHVLHKLNFGLFNIVDQLPAEVFAENARNATTWKEFVAEATSCRCFADFGEILIKFQKTILQCYIHSDWLQNSLALWVQQCHNADSAEMIEILTKELNKSIYWNGVKCLVKTELQPEYDFYLKTWKHEIMKWFLMENPVDASHLNNGTSSAIGVHVSQKRPKLEIRRAEAHAPVGSGGPKLAIAQFDTAHIHGQEGYKVESFRDVSGIVTRKQPTHGRGQQCIAFIEAKGRQCVRWANDGDVYCCVHLLSTHSVSKPIRERNHLVDTPLCGGTTTHGTRCKHRPLYGSSFCKKHQCQSDLRNSSYIPENSFKRKHDESFPRLETNFCRDIVLVGESENAPLQVNPVSVMEGKSNSSNDGHSNSSREVNCSETKYCIGLSVLSRSSRCKETPKRCSVYCEKHVPDWLKCVGNAKSRIISKEVFSNVLSACSSEPQMIQLHRACDLFYEVLKNCLLKKPVDGDTRLQFAMSEASQDLNIAQFLMKLVCGEKERLERLWGFDNDNNAEISIVENEPLMTLEPDCSTAIPDLIRCKLCAEEFDDDQVLGGHWMDRHKKEAQWFFRGYACAICFDSFTNKKILQAHVEERHSVPFVEHCLLLQCIPCGNHFGNSGQLWSHVFLAHQSDLRVSEVSIIQNQDAHDGSPCHNGTRSNLNNIDNQDERPKFVCRFCGLRFDLLPDLGRHHQAAHMDTNVVGPRGPKKANHFYSRLKSARLRRSRFRKGLGQVPYKLKRRAGAGIKRQIRTLPRIGAEEVIQSLSAADVSLGSLSDYKCSSVASMLFSEIQSTKPRPSNSEILSVARSTCCKAKFQLYMEKKYGMIPNRLYLGAARLCAEHNYEVNWHREDYICPEGCKAIVNSRILHPLMLSKNFTEVASISTLETVGDVGNLDESHCVLDLRHFGQNFMQKAVVLCDDISFREESVPVPCVVDKHLFDSLGIIILDGSARLDKFPMPWENFIYLLKPLMIESRDVNVEGLQLGCSCGAFTCHPEYCEHVYLFDNDYDDVRDIYGKPMQARFAYDEKRKIVLEEGYLVYECNHMCSCSNECQNRVLQHGVQVKLEVFRTEKKGWGVRAAETMPRGTFVCELIGEILDDHEALKRQERDYVGDCIYSCDMDECMNDVGRLVQKQAAYVVDATRYGNVSRFINHSCSPNLITYQVLVESMEPQFTHIGFYTSRDISIGEELTYYYRYKAQAGKEVLCCCGSSNCRGRLH